jgi:hypothetical protein
MDLVFLFIFVFFYEPLLKKGPCTRKGLFTVVDCIGAGDVGVTNAAPSIKNGFTGAGAAAGGIDNDADDDDNDNEVGDAGCS